MPGWLIPALKWGGAALTVIAIITLIYVQRFVPDPEAVEAAGQNV